VSTKSSPSTNSTAGNGEPSPLKPHQELDPTERVPVGKDPRRLSVRELNALGHHKRPLLRAIRENCVACSGGSPGEVRRCGLVTCPFWPYRLGTNPFVTRQLSLKQRESVAARLRPGGDAKTGASPKIPVPSGGNPDDRSAR
jgi:hypothetical protein